MTKNKGEYKEKIQNLNDSFLELILSDEEEAISVLKENEINVEELKKRALSKIKKIQVSVDLKLKKEQRKELGLLEKAKEKLKELGERYSSTPQEALGQLKLQLHFRNLKSIDIEDALDILEDADLLKLIEEIDKKLSSEKNE